MQKKPDNENLEVIEFNSQLLEQDCVFDFWRESIRPLFLAERKDDHKAEHIHHKVVKIDQIVVATGGFSSELFVRNRKHLLRNDDSDHLVIQWYVKGKCYVENGRCDYIQSPEHIVIMDMGYESFSNTVSLSSEIISFIVPRELLQEYWGPVDNLAGLSLPVNSTRGMLLKNFMVSLSEQLDNIRVSDASTVAQTITYMTSSMFQDEVKKLETAPEIIEVELRLLIQNFILENLRNPQLNADMLIQRFHCSRATLYRLFQRYGGVSRYINGLRLQRCYKHLAIGNIKRSQITKMAQYWGFSNRQQFTRQFRQYFDVSPSDVIIANADNLAFEVSHNSGNYDHNAHIIDSYRLASWLKELGYFTKG